MIRNAFCNIYGISFHLDEALCIWECCLDDTVVVSDVGKLGIEELGHFSASGVCVVGLGAALDLNI